MKKINFLIIASLLLALTLSTSIASAETAASSSPKAKKLDAAVARLIDRGDKAIANRIDALTELNTRIQDMKLVSADNKASLASQIQTQITNLNTLKSKIDADTDLATLKTDVKSITGSFRIFALVIPQGRIIASADRLNTVAGDLSVVANKLQTRLTEAQNAGKDITSLNTIFTELTAKISDAKTQATAAVSHVVNLTPDNDDATIVASNKDALKLSHSDIKVGQQDLVTARQDINKILKGLKAFKLPGTTGTSTASSTNP